ncbi:hypothetical protein [Gryllotalpicola protaetiae]|uniref:hypothetical protein n=1 Tax=Gryllotalpicola protaetiae TaxID=2419771 RepID=UPI0013C525D0|nr:hypothetical protein [Gryllotalpicola protaetiae]
MSTQETKAVAIWPMMCSVLTGAALIAFMGALPSIAINPVSILVYFAYLDVLGIVLTFGAVKLESLIAPVAPPPVGRAFVFATGGSFLAIPFAIVGLLVDGSAAAWIFGLVCGAVIGAVSGSLYPSLRTMPRLSSTLGCTWLSMGQLGVPFAVVNLVNW